MIYLTGGKNVGRILGSWSGWEGFKGCGEVQDRPGLGWFGISIKLKRDLD